MMLENVKDSGSQCVGCGRSSKIVPLRRLRTYARSLACFDCMSKYRSCGNLNLMGQKCNHEPHIGHICPYCGCPEYYHSLESEFDRQYAASVGKRPVSVTCESYGVNLGKCGNLIFADSSGQFSRLCASCERNWTREVMESKPCGI